jgi:UDP-N-acetylmuramyl pentapeptide phosphotransferase/UDP-N-acetylglucosamine-1-phosphate transferase
VTSGALSMQLLLLLLGCFVLAAAAVDLVRRHALRRRQLDIPNDRSSHSVPTPRGGGLGVVVVVAAAWVWVLVAWRQPRSVELPLCIAAMVVVAGVGWLDDRRGLGVSPRLGVHLLAGVAVAGLSARLGWPWWIGAAWLVWTVSSINVINFMDGIDGLIASQTMIAALSIAWLATPEGLARPFALAVTGVASGFLVWNWPPARIFLGDVGSGALGFALVLLGALVMAEGETDLARAFLPLFPLFLDAAWTMVRRARRGERITTAHRSHLYQRLANGGWGHRRVTLLYGAAAVVGALVAAVSAPAWEWPLVAAYAFTVVALGHSLDQRAMPAPRAAR